MSHRERDDELWVRLATAAEKGARAARNSQDPADIAHQVVSEMMAKDPLPPNPEAVAYVAGWRRSVNAEERDKGRRDRELRAVDRAGVASPEPEVMARLMVKELFAIARRECTTTEYEMLLGLYEAGGYTADAIELVARATGASTDAVRKRLERAMERMRDYLEEIDGDE